MVSQGEDVSSDISSEEDEQMGFPAPILLRNERGVYGKIQPRAHIYREGNAKDILTAQEYVKSQQPNMALCHLEIPGFDCGNCNEQRGLPSCLAAKPLTAYPPHPNDRVVYREN